jgi:NADPH-dependent ferric siderophore reductase
VFIEVAGPGEEQKLTTPGDAEIVWLHRGEQPVGNLLVETVTAMDFPAGRVHAFVHGEAGAVRQLRRHLLDERGLGSDQLSISGYWRRGMDDEAWRAIKAAEAQADAEADAAAGTRAAQRA